MYELEENVLEKVHGASALCTDNVPVSATVQCCWSKKVLTCFVLLVFFCSLSFLELTTERKTLPQGKSQIGWYFSTPFFFYVQ